MAMQRKAEGGSAGRQSSSERQMERLLDRMPEASAARATRWLVWATFVRQIVLALAPLFIVVHRVLGT
jgi:hypothetical protein